MVRNQIHVNKQKPKPSLFKPIKNRPNSAKPKGGFWTSPLLENGISPFERYENGALVSDKDKAWKIIPKKGCKVKYIKSKKELTQLPSVEHNSFHIDRTFIDFEEFFSQGYDGLHISGDIAHLKSFSDDYNLSALGF